MDKSELKNEIFNVAVIGGGPAGMMAAGRAAERGLSVILIEKNDTLGKKLLITGGGRCNVTNAEFDNRKLLEKFKKNGKFLFSSFSKWSVKETLDFFHAHSMDTKVEALQRVFPVSNKAESVWNVLVENLKKNKVDVLSKSEVLGFELSEGKIAALNLKNKNKIFAKNFILATGGLSRPETGSTGDGFKWLKELGHEVHEPRASLVPIAIKDPWIKNLSGKSIPDIKISSFQNGVKQDSVKGKILFTHVGISGPTVLNMSKDIGELLKYGDVLLSLDLLPKEDHGSLNKKLQDLFKEHNKKKLKNSLGRIIPNAIVPAILELSQINENINCSEITRENRLKLIEIIKNIPLHVEKLLGTDKAIITSGGVELSEVDFKTMQSKLYSNLYLVGDILNIDRPSGGYSLQLCWTTGFVAGDNVIR